MEGKIWRGAELPWPDGETLPGLAEANAERLPDATILVDVEGGVLTNAELARRSRKAARGLAAMGFSHGDCLCMLMPNGIEWYVAALAAQMLGGAVSGINPLATSGEISRQISRVPAKAILAAPPCHAAAEVAKELSVPILLSTAPGVEGTRCLAEIDGPPLSGPGRPMPDDPALLPFSSGSTGLPKPVVLTHRNLVAGASQIAHALELDGDSRLLGLAPLFHIVGPGMFVAAMLAGASILVLPGFEPAMLLEAAERHGVTHMPLMSPILRVLARHPAGDGRNWRRLRLVSASGAPLQPAVQADAARRFGCPVNQVYGMTETAGAVAMEAPGATGTGTVGHPVAQTSVRIVDPSSGECRPAREEGEIEVAGPQVTRGYLGLPADTARAITADGWLRTGDLGVFDTAGRLSLTGRIKELIKVNSSQVAPAELEMLLMARPAVAEAAVIGRPNPYCGEIPVAYLVLSEPADPFPIVDAVNDHVLPYKRLRAVEIVDALPRNAAGKLDRAALATLDRRRRSAVAAAAA